MPIATDNILALDVGERRIGVAIASYAARLPRPLTTLDHSPEIMADIAMLISQEQAGEVVLGLPRGLDGQSTAQTRMVEQFADKLKSHIAVPIYFQDEAVTSITAKKELQDRGHPYDKGTVDSLAAVYVLEDFIAAKKRGSHD